MRHDVIILLAENEYEMTVLGILGDVHESEPPLLSTTVNKLFPHVSSESRLTLFFLRIHVFDIATTAAIYYET